MVLKSFYVVVQAVDDGTVYFRDLGGGYPWLEEAMGHARAGPALAGSA